MSGGVIGNSRATETTQQQILAAISGGLVPTQYDSIELGYTGDNLTSVVYKLGATTVATLTLTYVGDLLTQVVRT